MMRSIGSRPPRTPKFKTVPASDDHVSGSSVNGISQTRLARMSAASAATGDDGSVSLKSLRRAKPTVDMAVDDYVNFKTESTVFGKRPSSLVGFSTRATSHASQSPVSSPVLSVDAPGGVPGSAMRRATESSAYPPLRHMTGSEAVQNAPSAASSTSDATTSSSGGGRLAAMRKALARARAMRF
jgi:hypothetical protein